MAAFDSFRLFLRDLSEKDREGLKEYIESNTADMLAARSEEARVRIAENFIRTSLDLSRKNKRH
jgi:hypothetical protein